MHHRAIVSLGFLLMPVKMLQPRRASGRDRACLYTYTLGFSSVFAAAWDVVSLGHNDSGRGPRGTVMEHAPGRLRIPHRHGPAITLALVVTEEVRR